MSKTPTSRPLRWRWHTRRRQYIFGVQTRTWLIGGQYELLPDCWTWYLGPVVLRSWRTER